MQGEPLQQSGQLAVIGVLAEAIDGVAGSGVDLALALAGFSSKPAPRQTFQQGGQPIPDQIDFARIRVVTTEDNGAPVPEYPHGAGFLQVMQDFACAGMAASHDVSNLALGESGAGRVQTRKNSPDEDVRQRVVRHRIQAFRPFI